MIFICYLLLFINLVSCADEETPIHYIFIGQGDEFDKCQKDKIDIENGQCKNHSHTYRLICDIPFVFNCSSDDSFIEADNNKFEGIIVTVGTNTPVFDLSGLPFQEGSLLEYIEFNPLYDINASDEDEKPSKTLSLKGCSLMNGSMTINNLKVNITEKNLEAKNIAILQSELIDTGFYPIAENYMSDIDSLELILAKKKRVCTNFIHTNYYFFNNVTVTFSSDSWTIVSYDYNDEKFEFSLPYFVSDRFAVFASAGVEIIFNIDDPASVKFKSIFLNIDDDEYTDSNVPLISTGDWDSLPANTEPLQVVIFNENITYDTDLLNKNFIKFSSNITKPDNPPSEVITKPPSEILGESYYIFVGQGDELNECKAAKQVIENDYSKCNDYAVKYSFNCERKNVVLLCAQNDDEFSKVNQETNEINLVIGTNPLPVDISILPQVETFEIFPLDGYHENDGKLKAPQKTVYLNGCNLKSYVIIFSLKVKVLGSNIITGKIMYYSCELIIDEFYIQSNECYGNEYFTEHYSENAPQICNRYEQIPSDYRTYTDNLTVTFTDKKWEIAVIRLNEESDSYYNEEFSVPYNIAKIVFLELEGDNLTFNINDPKTAKLKSIDLHLKGQEFSFFSTGDWNSLNSEPVKIILNEESRVTNYNTDSLNRYFFVFEPDIYPPGTNPTKPPNLPSENITDITPTNDPNLPSENITDITPTPTENTSDTSKKDNVDIGNITISSANDSGAIKSQIEKLFEKTESTEKVDHVVTIISDSDDEIVFNDLSLDSNQYIKVNNNANVKLTGGQLNLILDDKSSSVNVNVKNNDNVQLSIKNMNECTIKLNAESSNDEEKKMNISINTNSEVYGPLKFEVSENVQEIQITSINLHESGSVSSPVPVKVNKLVAQPDTKGKLSNVTVSNELTISQSAALELDEVSLTNAAINLNLQTYSSSNPILEGTLGEPPSTIALIKPEVDDSKPPSDNQKFLLFQGTFTTSCDDWKGKIDYGDTYFNDGVCDDVQALMMLDQKKQSLNVLHNPNKDNSNDDKKLSPGQIAGIAIGCIAGVAIIVVVIVVVIMKKKKNHQSSAESDNEQVDL